MMLMKQSITCRNREEWGAWLRENHQTQREVWLIYAKAHTRQPCVSYEDSVEEAICFGWVDSIIKRLDDDHYARKFTPRVNSLNWSNANKRRALKMIREGRMTDAGKAVLCDLSGFDEHVTKTKPPLEIPPDFQKMLIPHSKAWENFCRMPPSHQRQYVGWVMGGKKEETRKRRLQEAVRMLTKNKPLGMK